MDADRAGRTLAARWCDAVARGDVEAWAKCWRGDGEWHLAGEAPVVGIDAMTQAFATRRAEFELCLPELLFGWVEGGDGAAIARWYVREVQRTHAGTGQELVGWYDDRLVCDRGDWRFARRRFWLLYRGPRSVAGEVFRPQSPASP
jgi:ketosteroid isomerase-like protein